VPSLQELTSALHRVIEATGPWAPALLFGAAFIEYLFPPFPGDLLVVLGAWYAVHGDLSWPAVYGAVTAGAVAGAWVDHRIGVWLGARLEHSPTAARMLSPERLARFEAAYRRWGSWLLLLNRFFPGIRGFLFLAAGASGIPLSRTLILGGISAAVWNGLLLAAGALVAENLEELVALVDRYTRVAGAVVGLTLLLVLASALWSRRRARP
jgi:membrane protein DedA with SNARE-associated domain